VLRDGGGRKVARVFESGLLKLLELFEAARGVLAVEGVALDEAAAAAQLALQARALVRVLFGGREDAVGARDHLERLVLVGVERERAQGRGHAV
jgi:hypothetical protein